MLSNDLLWAMVATMIEDFSICRNPTRKSERREKIDINAFDFRLLWIIVQNYKGGINMT